MNINKSIEIILNKSWKPLIENYKLIEDGKYPGIYVIAWSDKNLNNKKINIKDIFYVGMSNSRKGITGRLKQFINSIEAKKGHSGGRRFCRDYCNGLAYTKSKQKKLFFIASHSIKCEVNKMYRTASDLKTMGEICRLEYYLLAHIKEHLGIEPELNKK